MSLGKMTTCLWFHSSASAEEAAYNYIRIFPHSHITNISRYTATISGHSSMHRNPHRAGDVISISFVLSGHPFTILNGGPTPGMRHTGAVSFIIHCDDQVEVDHYYEALGEGGPEKKKRCGWVTDKWGVVWQVVPRQLTMYTRSPDRRRVGRVRAAMMKMKKLDIEGLRRAYEGWAS